MNYLANAFAASMVADGTVEFRTINKEDVPADVTSCVGHADTAAVLQDMLGFPVPANRVSISLKVGDTLYLAQLNGGRLPEGATTLPDGFSFTFRRVAIVGEPHPLP